MPSAICIILIEVIKKMFEDEKTTKWWEKILLWENNKNLCII
jgi:hypothetical protein